MRVALPLSPHWPAPRPIMKGLQATPDVCGLALPTLLPFPNSMPQYAKYIDIYNHNIITSPKSSAELIRLKL